MASKVVRVATSKQFPYLQALYTNSRLTPYNGIFVPCYVDIKRLSQLHSIYEAQENDVFLATYLKAGQHWLKKICVEIMRHSAKDLNELHSIYKSGDIGMDTIPWLEVYYSQITNQQFLDRIENTDDTLRFWWVHLPFSHFPIDTFHKNTKIINVIRNPKDVVVSGFEFFNAVYAKMGFHHKQCEFDDYLSNIMSGVCNYGCYFDFYQSYWRLQDNKPCKMLWLYYEDMLDDPLNNIKTIATFLDKDADLNENDYESIVYKCSFDSMKHELAQNPQSFENGADVQFRKGIKNDWKNYFSQKQSLLMDEMMYFKWAQYCSSITYYRELMDKQPEFATLNHGYHS